MLLYRDLVKLGIDCPELSIAEWCDVVSAVTEERVFRKRTDSAVNKKGKPTGSIVPMLQPYFSSPRLDAKGKPVKEFDSKVFDANNVYTRTVLVSSLPEHIYPSLCTEIMKVSDDIVISLLCGRLIKRLVYIAWGSFMISFAKTFPNSAWTAWTSCLKVRRNCWISHY